VTHVTEGRGERSDSLRGQWRRLTIEAVLVFNSRRLVTLLSLAALSLVAISAAHAESSARIVQTQPAADATLGRQQSFFVRIEYDTDEAIRLWVRAYRNGTHVQKVMSNASPTYTGSGEALGWFALIEPGDIDEVRVLAGGGQPYREWELARESVELRWTDDAPSTEPQEAWVTDLLEIETARQQEDAQRRASEPTSAGGTVVFGGFMLAVLVLLVAGIGVPVWSAWKWRGGWRIAAAVPAAVILFVVLRIVVGTARDPTSLNLWPFEILQFGIVALVIIGGLKLARRFLGVTQ
jgi:hypothetical protein